MMLGKCFIKLSWVGAEWIVGRIGIQASGAGMGRQVLVTIQPMPNRGDQKVFVKGMPMFPPLAKALQAWPTAASSGKPAYGSVWP